MFKVKETTKLVFFCLPILDSSLFHVSIMPGHKMCSWLQKDPLEYIIFWKDRCKSQNSTSANIEENEVALD
jgi:hypothetical protein